MLTVTESAKRSSIVVTALVPGYKFTLVNSERGKCFSCSTSSEGEVSIVACSTFRSSNEESKQNKVNTDNNNKETKFEAFSSEEKKI